MPINRSLGYHKFGEYTFFNIFSEGIPYIGGGRKNFYTHEDFGALVTDVHESFHVMQEMLQGFCLWDWSVKFKIAGLLSEVLKNKPRIKYQILLLTKNFRRMTIFFKAGYLT
jgi:hypothetical protein